VIPTLEALMPLVRPLMDMGCAIDIALPAGSFAARFVYHVEHPRRLNFYDYKGRHVLIIL
jgi:hypothetical protein